MLIRFSLIFSLVFLISFVDHRSVISSDSTSKENPHIFKEPYLHKKGKLSNSTGMAFLGPDDILVLEKNTGKVKRVLNGSVIEEPLLDVTVSNQYERGLLGIAVSKDTNNSKTYVFLYYTEAEPNEQEDISYGCPEINKCESGNPAGHRLYKYELELNEENKTEAKLVNPHLLLDLPSNSGADHLGGSITIGPDGSIYVITGDGNSEADDSCEDGLEDSVLNAQSANVKEGDPPEGRGGIIRVTADGQVVNGEGILGDEHPLDKYYAYGIRNSFGIDFDPVTGNLWSTENGPSFGDEINLVEPGFNSGWMRFQGMWPIAGCDLLSPGRGGIDGHPYSNPMCLYPIMWVCTNDIGKTDPVHFDGVGNYNDFVHFDGVGNYSQPEFTWNIPVGVTAISFLDSEKLGIDYQNDLFVGGFNMGGTLYHFDLTESRIELSLNGSLKDKVADNMLEVEQVTFAERVGKITDIEVGPDGYLYVLTYNGYIYRFVRS